MSISRSERRQHRTRAGGKLAACYGDAHEQTRPTLSACCQRITRDGIAKESGRFQTDQLRSSAKPRGIPAKLAIRLPEPFPDTGPRHRRRMAFGTETPHRWLQL